MTAPESPARHRSSLRRNLVPLVVLAASIPALAFVLLYLPIAEEEQGNAATVVPYGEPFEAGGYEWTLDVSQEFEGRGSGDDGNEIPIGSSLVGMLIDVTPLGSGESASSCSTELTSRSGGIDRSWDDVSSPEDFNYTFGDETSPYCLLDEEAFVLELLYLVPAGAYDDATLDLTLLSEGRATILRFELQ
jgi:hypothetical protein